MVCVQHCVCERKHRHSYTDCGNHSLLGQHRTSEAAGRRLCLRCLHATEPQASSQELGSASRQVVAGTHQSASSSGVVSPRLGRSLLPLRSQLVAQSGKHLHTQAGQTTLVLVLPRSGVHLQPIRRQTCCRNSVEQHQLLGQVSTFCSSSSMSLDSSDAIPLLPRAHPTPCA